MFEKLTGWQEMLATLCVVPDNGALADDHAKVIKFPFDGQIFEDVFILKLPSEDEPYFLMDCLCEELQNLLGEIGTYDMDECLFRKEDVVVVPGLYALTLKYHSEDCTDWESGIKDYRPGFNVLEVKKI